MTGVVASRRARWIPSTRAAASCPAGIRQEAVIHDRERAGIRESIRNAAPRRAASSRGRRDGRAGPPVGRRGSSEMR